jgi:glycosyltransferase involved in cell wall biosynthesis
MATTDTPTVPTDTSSTTREIAVVVLALGAPAVLVEAVRSLLVQDVVPEVLVVNSGGGDARRLLAAHDLDVPVLEFTDRLFVGAARNAGIAATQAPIVAFLACDCLAKPGWVANRLARHRAGHVAVGSAVVNSHPRNLFAWAGHVCTYARRLPQVPEKSATRFGVSYMRCLFAHYGLFREDLRTSEDSEFHQRLSEADEPVWAPEVRTVHRNPTSLQALVADQFRRGRHVGKANAALAERPAVRLALHGCRGIRRSHRIARRALNGSERAWVMAAWPVVMIGMLAHVTGIVAFCLKRR